MPHDFRFVFSESPKYEIEYILYMNRSLELNKYAVRLVK